MDLVGSMKGVLVCWFIVEDKCETPNIPTCTRVEDEVMELVPVWLGLSTVFSLLCLTKRVLLRGDSLRGRMLTYVVEMPIRENGSGHLHPPKEERQLLGTKV